VGANTFVTPGTATLTLTTSKPILNGIIPTPEFYFDTDGELYMLLEESLPLIERIS
jgi:hypothetical protein